MYIHTQTETNNDPYKHTTQRLFGLPRLSLWLTLILCVLLTSQSRATERTALTVGLASTNWNNQAAAGILIQHNDHFATFSAVDVGGGVTATQVQPAVTFKLDPCCMIGFMLGPEVAIYQEHPSIDEKLTYLNSALGAFVWLDAGPKFSIIATAEFVDSDANLSRYKLRIQLAIWLHE